MRDGKGWSGIAYWGSSGNCNIGIDGPMVLDGVGTGDDGVIFHEVQHYTQYSYNDGCYADFKPLYSDGNAWIEGWANLAGKNATNAANDADYSVSSYDSLNSYYDLDYTDLHAQYLIEQYGGNGAPGDPAFGVKAVYEHYRKCDQYDDIFVMDETIQALTGGAKTEKWAFVDFEAAYYAYPYADPVSQPELVFPDTDDQPTGTPAFSQNVNMDARQPELGRIVARRLDRQVLPHQPPGRLRLRGAACRDAARWAARSASTSWPSTPARPRCSARRTSATTPRASSPASRPTTSSWSTSPASTAS